MEAAGEEGGEAKVDDGEETHLGDMKTKEMSTTAKQCLELMLLSCNAIISQNKICIIYLFTAVVCTNVLGPVVRRLISA